MIRIVIGNYLLTGVILASYSLLDLFVARNLLQGAPNGFLEQAGNMIGSVIISAKPTIILVMYFILLLWIATKSRIGLGFMHNDIMKRILTVLYIPFTVISIVTNLALAVFGTKVLELSQLVKLSEFVSDNRFLHNMIILTPLWILLPGLITVVLASYSLMPRLEMSEE
jgi:hypothetical protein